tara:strand:+ start:328 stop:504 length:177 start_codon:yes stop_codon:yes gene_type:complete
MFGKLKSNLLTYLFKDWVDNETDVETLNITKRIIRRRVNVLVEDTDTGRVIIKGFNRK